MGLLTFGLNVTLDGCCDHREGIADDELLRYFTRLMDAGGAMLFGRARAAGADRRVPSRRPPVLAGHGPNLFQGLERSRRLELVSTKRLKSGVMALHYRRKDG